MPILVTCECGKQFQTGDANVGRKTNCPNCGRDLVVPKAGDPFLDDAMSPASTSGKAITSLILGIISLVVGCLFFTGIPAIIVGAMGLSDIKKSRGRTEGKGLAVTGIVLGSVATFLGLLIIPIMIALFIPAIQAGQAASQRSQCINNLKQIGLALFNYESKEGQFPPSAIKDKDGKPLLSWRVAILPYLGENAQYSRFKLDEPWDSPTNMAAAAQMPPAYLCPNDPPGSSGQTGYQVIVGPKTIFDGDGSKVFSITDGTSNTIAVIEAKTHVPWAKPDDVDISTIAASIGSRHPGGANVLFADGSVHFIKLTVNPKILNALCTKNGGEVISDDSY